MTLHPITGNLTPSVGIDAALAAVGCRVRQAGEGKGR